MPIGILTNVLSVLLGGLLGATLGKYLPERIRISLPLVFGIAAMGMGVASIVKLKTLPAVVLALIVGTFIGEWLELEAVIEKAAGRLKPFLERLLVRPAKTGLHKEVQESSISAPHQEAIFLQQFVAILILFSCSGTGIFGAMTEGMTGDSTILLTKSILDFFTAIIFASTLGAVVAAICIPQAIIYLLLFFSAAYLLPSATPDMILDFTACGGLIMLATGFRISGLKAFPIANMLPALVLVMPFSHLWTLLSF
jgi:uncharacterized membrane protein YqgA involved in biofilm formation